MGTHLLSFGQRGKKLHLDSPRCEDDDSHGVCHDKNAVVDGNFSNHAAEEDEYEEDNGRNFGVTRLLATSLPGTLTVCRGLDFSHEIVHNHPKQHSSTRGAPQISSRTAESTKRLGCKSRAVTLQDSKANYDPSRYSDGHATPAHMEPEITAASSASTFNTRSFQKHIATKKISPRTKKLSPKGCQNRLGGCVDRLRKDKSDAGKRLSSSWTCGHVVKPTPVFKSKRTSGYNYGLPLTSPAAQRKKHTGEQRITVCVRKRPLTHAECMTHVTDVVATDGEDCVIVHKNKEAVDLTQYILQHRFYFDQVFGEGVSNELVYLKTAYPLVQHMLNGGKATCFAYGQTGAGKTHTMLGSPPTIPGLYTLAARDIFAHLSTLDSAPSVFVSFFEIYCGQLYDLLDHRKRLFAREDSVKVVHIAGMTSIHVDSISSLLKVISQGTIVRTQGVSGANPFSSRSHALLQIQLRGPRQQIMGRIWFVDLAGSERASDAKQPGKHSHMEGAEINQSLLALKECIRCLDQEQAHTPFRQSKLTQVLRDSFVGDSKTCMIANISPGDCTSEHTLNTLRYADRVKELRVQTVTRRGGANTKAPNHQRTQMSSRSSNSRISVGMKSLVKNTNSPRKGFAQDPYTASALSVSMNLCSTPNKNQWREDPKRQDNVVAECQQVTPVTSLSATFAQRQKKRVAAEMESWRSEDRVSTEGSVHSDKRDHHARDEFVLAQSADSQGRFCDDNPQAQRISNLCDGEKLKKEDNKQGRGERTLIGQPEIHRETCMRGKDFEDMEAQNRERKRHLRWYHQQLQQCTSSLSSSSSSLFPSASVTSSLSSSNYFCLSSPKEFAHQSVHPIPHHGLEKTLDVNKAENEDKVGGNKERVFLHSRNGPSQPENNDEGDRCGGGSVVEDRTAYFNSANLAVKEENERAKIRPLDLEGNPRRGGLQNKAMEGRRQKKQGWVTAAEEVDRMASTCRSEMSTEEEGSKWADATCVAGQGSQTENVDCSCCPVSECSNNFSFLEHVHSGAERPLSQCQMLCLSPEKISRESPNTTMDPLSLSQLEVTLQPATTSFLQGEQEIDLRCPTENDWKEADGSGGSAQMAGQVVGDEEEEFKLSHLDVHARQAPSVMANNHVDRRADIYRVSQHRGESGIMNSSVPVGDQVPHNIKSNERPQAIPDNLISSIKSHTLLKSSLCPSTRNLVSSSVRIEKDTSHRCSHHGIRAPVQMPPEHITDRQTTLGLASNCSNLNTGQPCSAGSAHQHRQAELHHRRLLVVQANWEQQRQMEALCYEEKTLLNQQPKMVFMEYIEKLKEIMEKQTRCVNTMSSQLQTYLKPSPGNYHHDREKESHHLNT